MKKVYLLLLLVAMFVFTIISQPLCGKTNSSEYATDAIEAVSVNYQSIGPGWRLQNSFYLPPNVVSQFGHNYDSTLIAVKNDIFQKNETKVQVNYIEAIDKVQAEKAYNAIVAKVGKYNVIALKGNIVIEIITKDFNAKTTILSGLDADKAHKNY